VTGPVRTEGDRLGPETLCEGPALALAGVLGVPRPDTPDTPDAGLTLPLLWHWLYLLDRPAQADLGDDGHPRRTLDAGDGLTSRLFAGGRVATRGALRTGRPATRTSSLVRDVLKAGRSGPLRVVTHRYVYEQDGAVVVEDERDLVYRRPAPPSADVPREADPARPRPQGPAPAGLSPPQDDALGRLELETSPPLLFRFSALTYNAHRIHYDRDYARDAEGHPGLVVHGPLQALAMAEAARPHLPAGRSLRFEYRLVAPLFEGQGLVAVATTAPDGGLATRVQDRAGRSTATGTITLR
jgi:3-methylfumaryl-CoA hydratase